jgi:2-dehydropantoate 2-reductase
MKILVVGAGAVGGYFGGRLLQSGRDVTFLVRPVRAEALAARGLRLQSPLGDFHLPDPPSVTIPSGEGAFDLILLSCKAYDLEGAMDSIAPFVGSHTAILPLLNGMRHLESLAARFGSQHVLGGLCVISTTLSAGGDVIHLNEVHNLVYGELDGARSERALDIEAAFSQAGFDARLSSEIALEMWEKWVFIASAAGITCLMRASIGDIVAAGAAELAANLLEECAVIAKAAGFPPRAAFLERIRANLIAPGSPLTASMLRDIETGGRVEGEQVLGDLLRRAPPGIKTPVLSAAHFHVKAYETRRSRAVASTV